MLSLKGGKTAVFPLLIENIPQLVANKKSQANALLK
jgi:hypothetical protein